MINNESPGGDRIIAESSTPESVRRMVFTVNAIVSEQCYGYQRRMNENMQWEWTLGEGEAQSVQAEPLDVVHNPALAVQAIEAMVDQNEGVQAWINYGVHKHGWEVTLHEGERKAAHVSGRPFGMMLGLAVVSALGLQPQEELEKLFPIRLING